MNPEIPDDTSPTSGNPNDRAGSEVAAAVQPTAPGSGADMATASGSGTAGAATGDGASKASSADANTAQAAPPRKIRIGFVVNDVATEKDNFTTIRLARRAIALGHEVALIGLGDFLYDANGSVRAHAHLPRGTEYADDAALLADLQADDGATERLAVDELDVLMLRSDPADEVLERPWAPSSGLLFAQLVALRHVIVLNDPTHLTDASNKTYFQHFPEEVRPITCITRDPEEIKAFIKAHGGRGVIKPLQGSGGQGVFVIKEDGAANLNQMIDAVVRDGYAIAQEYLPKAVDGDLRLLTLNGRPLQVDGQYACFRRYNDSGDARSNISAGGKIAMAVPDEAALRLAEMVAPKLIADGMYLTGLDIVGDKMMEINVDTPGGINMAEDLTGVDFSGHIIADLERKVRLRDYYGRTLDNLALSML